MITEHRRIVEHPLYPNLPIRLFSCGWFMSTQRTCLPGFHYAPLLPRHVSSLLRSRQHHIGLFLIILYWIRRTPIVSLTHHLLCSSQQLALNPKAYLAILLSLAPNLFLKLFLICKKCQGKEWQSSSKDENMHFWTRFSWRLGSEKMTSPSIHYAMILWRSMLGALSSLCLSIFLDLMTFCALHFLVSML